MLDDLKNLIRILWEPLPPAEPIPAEFETVLPSVEVRGAYLQRWADESGEEPEAMVLVPYSIARDLLKADESLSLAVNALKEISGNPIRRDNRFPARREVDIARSALTKIRELIPIGGLIDEMAKRMVDTPRKLRAPRKV